MKNDGTLHDGTLHETARKLGESAADRLDVEGIAQKVVQRLKDEPVRRTTWIQQSWLRIAAVLVLVLGGAVVASRLTPGRRPGVSPAHVAHFVVDDLSDFSTDELRALLTSFDELVASDSDAVPESNDLRELDAQQLRAVLRSLEG